MSDLTPAQMKIVKALLAGSRRGARGRPRKRPMQDTDTIRAALVVWVYLEHPGRFKTRREAMMYLQSLAETAGKVAAVLKKEGHDLDYTEALESIFWTFPYRELEQSVSRGMNKHNRFLGRLEKLAK